MNKYGFIKGSNELEMYSKALKAEYPDGTFYGITRSKQVLVFSPPKWRPVNVVEFASAMNITIEQAKLILDSRGRTSIEEAIELTEFVNDREVEPEVEVAKVETTPTPMVIVEEPKSEVEAMVETIVETIVALKDAVTLEPEVEPEVEEEVEVEVTEPEAVEEVVIPEPEKQEEPVEGLTLEAYIDLEIKKAIAELREELVKDLLETFAKLQRK